MKIANLTPHPITLIKCDGSTVNVEPFGFVLRVSEKSETLGEVYGIRLIKKTFSDIPENDIDKLKEIASANDIVIVSAFCCKYLRERNIVINNVFFISNTIRDANGRVVGADAITRAEDIN